LELDWIDDVVFDELVEDRAKLVELLELLLDFELD